jgi:hypothetical protein
VQDGGERQAQGHSNEEVKNMHIPFGRALIGSALGLLAAAGCGSSSPAATNGTPGNGTPAVGSCANNQLVFLFDALYSANDGGAHKYQIPEALEGFNTAANAAAVTWSASDPSMVDLTPGWSDKNGVTGVLIQTRKSGTVNIVASVGGLCGSVPLTITAADPNDWMIGSVRYNTGVTLTRMGGGGGPGGGLRPATDAGTPAACNSCHGDVATASLYRTVQHTPEQIGGFTDAELINIFRNAMFPSPDDFDTTVQGLNLQTWTIFHHWSATDEEAKGLTVYLRSLTPSAQTGAANFGGAMMGDGGFRRRGDGGRPPRPPGAQDAAASD